MLLYKLTKGLTGISLPKDWRNYDVAAICSDSRKVVAGSLFVAIHGPNQNGHAFIKDAVSRGAKAIIHEEDYQTQNPDVLAIQVKDAHHALGQLLLNLYNHKQQKIKLVGITGTNGKTTITYLLESILTTLRKSCGVIGTVNYRYGRLQFEAHNTTPGVIDIHHYLNQMADQGVQYCLMEVSSHALHQRRLEGLSFNTGVFTNLTQDHMDYHKNFEEYFKAKSLLFTGLDKSASAVINLDDAYGKKMCSLSKCKRITYGINEESDIRARSIKLELTKTLFTMKTPQGEVDIQSPLIGKHNVYNIMAAAGAALSLGFSLSQIKTGIEALQNVPGRLERVHGSHNFVVLIDYAHTPDAMKNVLESVREICRKKIILVFGCGGDRDKLKRPLMAKIASTLADFSIITNDNPRTEDPQEILRHIIEGYGKDSYVVIENRKEAIHNALDMAKEGDVVLIAGKGHEKYQIFKDRTVDFDEHKIVSDYLQLIKK